MITDKLINIIFNVIEGLLSNFPNLSIDFDTEVMAVVLGIIEGILYFFPLAKLIPIIYLIVALQSFRIGIRLVRTILSLIPFV